MIIVTGLPRSGTSMMMRMLDKGGVPTAHDGFRDADEDNPNGYYECEQVKDEWWNLDMLPDGLAIKIVTMHLQRLTHGNRKHLIIFMNRDLDEIMDSQNKMLTNKGKRNLVKDTMGPIYSKHLNGIWDWIAQQDNLECAVIGYDWVLEDPKRASEKIAEFIGRDLDTEKMAGVVDPSLYRNRRKNGIQE